MKPSLAVRNYDADYFVDKQGYISNKGRKRYAVEIQNESGDVIEYTSANSEAKAKSLIKHLNSLFKTN